MLLPRVDGADAAGWRCFHSGRLLPAGQEVTLAAPLSSPPLLARLNCAIPIDVRYVQVYWLCIHQRLLAADTVDSTQRHCLR